MTGRPTSFTQEKADYICDQLCLGRSLRSICDDENTPSIAAVLRWLEQQESFRSQYARARNIQAEVIFDEMHSIADTTKIGIKTIRKESGVEIIEADMIEHRRLQIETRKWMLGKMAPKKYGDKTQVEHSGPGGAPIETRDVSDDVRAKALLAFLTKTGAKLP